MSQAGGHYTRMGKSTLITRTRQHTLARPCSVNSIASPKPHWHKPLTYLTKHAQAHPHHLNILYLNTGQSSSRQVLTAIFCTEGRAPLTAGFGYFYIIKEILLHMEHIIGKKARKQAFTCLNNCPSSHGKERRQAPFQHENHASMTVSASQAIWEPHRMRQSVVPQKLPQVDVKSDVTLLDYRDGCCHRETYRLGIHRGSFLREATRPPMVVQPLWRRKATILAPVSRMRCTLWGWHGPTLRMVPLQLTADRAKEGTLKLEPLRFQAPRKDAIIH